MSSLRDLNPDSPSLGKKRYSPPQLQVYGELREITTTVGTKGNNDGGNPPNQKTKS